MRLTVNQLLERTHTAPETTSCGALTPEALAFPFNVSDTFCMDQGGSEDTVCGYLFENYLQEEEKKEAYRGARLKLLTEEKRLRTLRLTESGEETAGEKMRLRAEKQELAAKLSEMDAENRRAAAARLRQSGKPVPELSLQYKKVFHCAAYSDVLFFLPQLRTANMPMLDRMPLFVRGIASLAESLRRKESVGVVGGPCLFGAYDVDIVVTAENGETVRFDFSSGRERAGNALLDRHIEDYFARNGGLVKNISFRRNKTRVTRPERLSILYPFEAAAALGGSIVFPIPDMSYAKFLESVVSPAAPRVRDSALEGFLPVADAICDLYLSEIEAAAKAHPGVPYLVMHRRNELLYREFLKKRNKYLGRMTDLHRLTEHECKFEAVRDYITMLAMPYYFFGSQHVLQIDSADEADSMRKCIRIHRGDTEFHSILYPEYLSADGEHTVFNALPELKEYI